MTYALNDEQRQLQNLVRRVARERVAPRAQEIDRDGRVSAGHVRPAEGARPVHAAVPGRVRRQRQPAVAPASRSRNSAASATTPPTCCSCSGLPFGAILAGGNDEQKRRFLPGLAIGRACAARILADRAAERLRRRRHPHARSSVSMAAIAQRRQDLVHERRVADFILVAAKTGDERRAAAASISSSSSATRKGLTIGRKEDKTGRARRPVLALFLRRRLRPRRRTDSAPRARASRS